MWLFYHVCYNYLDVEFVLQMNNKVNKHFNLAKVAAESGDSKDADRQYRIGAVGIRREGTIVISNNICTRTPHPGAHAETRLVKKLNSGSIVYVVRISRENKLSNARPCKSCRKSMDMRGIKKCYYSISENEYGIIDF